MIIDHTDIHEQPDGTLWLALPVPIQVLSPDRQSMLLDPTGVLSVGDTLAVTRASHVVNRIGPEFGTWKHVDVGQVRIVEVMPIWGGTAEVDGPEPERPYVLTDIVGSVGAWYPETTWAEILNFPTAAPGGIAVRVERVEL